MSLLRFVSLLILALWVGGLAALGGVAAPALFDALGARDPAGGGTAGWLFGLVFRRFQHVSWWLGGLLILLLGARAALGPRPRRLAVRVWVVAIMLTMSLTSALVLAPRIEAIRTQASGAVHALPDGDARKTEFGRLHGIANILMLITLAAGAGLMWAELRDTH
jgi:Domain of unknown function (DUF4149)